MGIAANNKTNGNLNVNGVGIFGGKVVGIRNTGKVEPRFADNLSVGADTKRPF